MTQYESADIDIIALNRFERNVKILAGEIHDCAFEDIEEMRLKLHDIVSICSEMLTRAERLECLQADPIDEPYDSAWVKDFNR